MQLQLSFYQYNQYSVGTEALSHFLSVDGDLCVIVGNNEGIREKIEINGDVSKKESK